MFSSLIQQSTLYFRALFASDIVIIIKNVIIMTINSYLAMNLFCFILDAITFIAKMVGKFVWNNLTPGQKLVELLVIIAIIMLTFNISMFIIETKNKDNKQISRLKKTISKLKVKIAEKDAEIMQKNAELAEKNQFISESASLFDDIEKLSEPI